jgi:hypothetical protein
MMTSQSKLRREWKKYVLLGIAFTVVPGSSLIMVGYGIKKLLERRKRSQDVQTQGFEERIIPDP